MIGCYKVNTPVFWKNKTRAWRNLTSVELTAIVTLLSPFMCVLASILPCQTR